MNRCIQWFKLILSEPDGKFYKQYKKLKHVYQIFVISVGLYNLTFNVREEWLGNLKQMLKDKVRYKDVVVENENHSK